MTFGSWTITDVLVYGAFLVAAYRRGAIEVILKKYMVAQFLKVIWRGPSAGLAQGPTARKPYKK